MPTGIFGLWLAAQMVIEVLLCSVIIYYICREKNSTKAMRREQEKTTMLIRTLDRLVDESEKLEKKHSDLLHLWETIEKKGKDLETYIDYYKRKCVPVSAASTEKSTPTGKDSTRVDCYEKTLRLIEKGVPAREIAQEVGLPAGEVELIMNLRGH